MSLGKIYWFSYKKAGIESLAIVMKDTFGLKNTINNDAKLFPVPPYFFRGMLAQYA